MIAILISNSPDSPNRLERIIAHLYLLVITLGGVAWIVWRISAHSPIRQRIDGLHGGQLGLLLGFAVVPGRLVWLLCQDMLRQPEFGWGLAGLALLDAFATAFVALPWRWFDSRKADERGLYERLTGKR